MYRQFPRLAATIGAVDQAERFSRPTLTAGVDVTRERSGPARERRRES